MTCGWPFTVDELQVQISMTYSLERQPHHLTIWLVKRLMSYEALHGTAATEHGKRHDHARRTYRSYMNYPGHTGLTVQPSGLTLHDTMSFLGVSAMALSMIRR